MSHLRSRSIRERLPDEKIIPEKSGSPNGSFPSRYSPATHSLVVPLSTERPATYIPVVTSPMDSACTCHLLSAGQDGSTAEPPSLLHRTGSAKAIKTTTTSQILRLRQHGSSLLFLLFLALPMPDQLCIMVEGAHVQEERVIWQIILDNPVRTPLLNTAHEKNARSST